jgi:tripartite-type tricarboxylate transporter receptor subunit TctC
MVKHKGGNAVKGKLVLFAFMALFLMVSSVSWAQEFPTKPINILVGAGPGGSQDTSTRLIAKKAEKTLGQPIILNNNPGGAGVVALTITKNMKADGYNLVAVGNGVMICTPHLRKVEYAPEDFVPVLQYAESHIGLYVRGDSQWKTFKEFITYVRQNPDKINYTTPAVGSGMHIAMEYISAQEKGLKWTLVPYTVGDPIVPLLGNHVQATSGSIAPTSIPHLKSGTLRLLAVYSDKRLKMFPDVPTIKELGYDFAWDNKSLLLAPKATSPAIVTKLEDILRKAAADPEYVKTIEGMLMDPTYMSSADVKKYITTLNPRMAKLISQLNIPKE